MADRFIDQDETQIYGPYASKRILGKLLGLVPEYDDALKFSASKLDTHTAAVQAAVSAAREKDASLRQGSQDKAPILEKARRLLGQFGKHLDAHDEGVVDRKVFFVKDGTVAGIGRAAPDVLLAITHITTKLGDPKCKVRELAYWHERFDTTMKELAPVIAFADDARIDRQSLTPEVEATRQGWLNTYVATKNLVESLLRHLGRLEQMPLFFYDLRVPAGTKVTEPPPEA